MRYMFLIYSQETVEGPTAEEGAAIMAQHAALIEDTARKGILMGVDPLKPTAAATTLRTGADGEAMLTDGPFAETKEQLAGYYILECRDLDEAIEYAKRIPTGCRGGQGCIEIRPVADIPKPAVGAAPAVIYSGVE